MGFFNRLFGGGQGQANESPEYRRLIERAMAELQAKTTAHDGAWGLGGADWSVDQDVGLIEFTTPGGVVASAPVQIIGTYSTESETWLWGWDHPSVEPALAEHASQVFAYGQEHGIDRLTTQEISCTEQDCWEFTALACLLCKAQGAYRGPAGPALVFMTFGDVKLSKAG